MQKKKIREEMKKKFHEIKMEVEKQGRRISDLEKNLLEVIYELRSLLEENLRESGSKIDSLLELEKSLLSERKKKEKDRILS